MSISDERMYTCRNETHSILIVFHFSRQSNSHNGGDSTEDIDKKKEAENTRRTPADGLERVGWNNPLASPVLRGGAVIVL
jgi:hypothetical protein